ncbi:hypothetical protein [Treponema sp.]|uniref:hypothetical protein n=1 Tax=Treponema sp. TaxID=166 RepID=UPI0025D6F048|nr:hypothetical protein [Treponema sp.]MCR5217361.1 hypothetical protein [Treponema sp.]
MKRILTFILTSTLALSLASGQDFSEDDFPPPPPGAFDMDGDFEPGNGKGGDGFGTVADEKEPDLKAVKVLEDGDSFTGVKFTSKSQDQSVLLAEDGIKASLSDSTLNKKKGDTSKVGQSNFYGLNAAVVAKSGANLQLNNVTIRTIAEGSNAVFATGEGSRITIDGIKIQTDEDSSRGLDATYGGTVEAKNVDITTKGAHCAAFATDRGEGNIIVDSGKASTAGQGSPVIYSTGNIRVANITGSATGSEIAVIEGKNSISITDSEISGGTDSRRDTGCGIMLYQSMSGDANRGTSVFSASNSRLISNSDGAFFYVTNTDAKINLSNTELVNSSGILLQVTQNYSSRGWGKQGANGGTLEFNAQNQQLAGKVITDSISKITMNLKNGTSFKGSINEEKSGPVNLNISKDATVELTANSYVNILSDGDSSFANIKSNGYTLFYNKNAEENKALGNKVINLADGGKIIGIEMTWEEVTPVKTQKQGRPGKPPAGAKPKF